MPKSRDGEVTYESPAVDGLTEELRGMTEEDLRCESEERERARLSNAPESKKE